MAPAERAEGHSSDLFVPLLVSSTAGKSSEPTQADCLPMNCGPAHKGSRANQISTSGIWTKNAEAFRQLAVGWRTGTHWKVLHGRVWAAMWGETRRRPGQEKVCSEKWDSREDGEKGSDRWKPQRSPWSFLVSAPALTPPCSLSPERLFFPLKPGSQSVQWMRDDLPAGWWGRLGWRRPDFLSTVALRSTARALKDGVSKAQGGRDDQLPLDYIRAKAKGRWLWKLSHN